MMRLSRYGLSETWRPEIWLFAVLLVLPSQAQEPVGVRPENYGVSSEKVAELSKYMHSLVVQDKIAGGVTLMARKGQVVHLQAVGKADREVGDDMRTDTIFRIASMTKPVTSVAVMILVEEGKIDLDDPVSKFIPEFRNPRVLVSGQTNQSELAQSEITIKHLLTHSSGLV